jgi:hypothetical protein
MIPRKTIHRLTSALFLISLLHAPPVFQAQANVLLLAHFDERRLNADYSAGGLTGGSAGSGARGGELGVFKGAADLGYRTPTAASFSLPAGHHRVLFENFLGLVGRRRRGSGQPALSRNTAGGERYGFGVHLSASERMGEPEL